MNHTLRSTLETHDLDPLDSVIPEELDHGGDQADTSDRRH